MKRFIRIWKFQVNPGKEVEFERAYGPSGDWVQLFCKNGGFLKTELHRDLTDHHCYITLDYFKSKADFEALMKQCKDEYAAMDRRYTALTSSEENIGIFEPILL